MQIMCQKINKHFISSKQEYMYINKSTNNIRFQMINMSVCLVNWNMWKINFQKNVWLLIAHLSCSVAVLTRIRTYLNVRIVQVFFLYGMLNNIFLFFWRFCWFIFRKRGREGEGEVEKHQCVVALEHPYRGPGLQPRQVPWLGIELATLWFAIWCSIHWATPVSA